jgi:hypothetical protein
MRVALTFMLLGMVVTGCTGRASGPVGSQTPVFPTPGTNNSIKVHAFTGNPTAFVHIRTRQGAAPVCEAPDIIPYGSMLRVEAAGDAGVAWLMPKLMTKEATKDPDARVFDVDIQLLKRGHFEIVTRPPTLRPCGFTVR